MCACAAVSVVVIPSGKLTCRIRFKYDVTVFIAEIIVGTKLSAVHRYKVPGQPDRIRIFFNYHK